MVAVRLSQQGQSHHCHGTGEIDGGRHSCGLLVCAWYQALRQNAAEDVALAHGTAGGTATGRLYGAPATKRSFQASFFDYVRIDDGRIIERVQQADVLAQMRQLYGKALGLVGLDAMFLRL
jgi:SnoaL-like polyketide cyclase